MTLEASKEYTSRREHWHAARLGQERLFIRIGNWRLILGVIEAILGYFAFANHRVPAWTLLIPLLAFVALAVWHSRVLRRKTLAVRAIAFYDRNLARIENRWTSNPATGERFRDPEHIYAEDLDLFGKGGLFQLLSTARTQAGEQILAKWLLHPTTKQEALGRQTAVRDLATRLDLREELALLGEDVQATLDLDVMERWGTAPPVVFAPILRWISAVLATLSILCLYGFFAQRAQLWQLLGTWVLDGLMIFLLRDRVNKVLEAAETPGHGLQVFSLILGRLEQENFPSPYLQALVASINTQGAPASARIKALGRCIDWFDSSDHILVKAIRPLVLWREQIAMAIEAWRNQSGPQIATWLRAVAEFEALSAFASLAFERPHYSYPEFNGMAPLFEAKGLQHPLLSFHSCVPNDVFFNHDSRLLIVSGSNMSGKSTLLRAVGLNCVLAWAGAPVSATSLCISPLQLGASIRVTDSLMDNRSRFFAEITRLRQVVELTRKGHPVLFLFDELLSGTNSHDRRIGAAAIVTKLVRDGAIGLITTHDLALADIQKDLGSNAANVHFDDRIVNGQVEFNYRLQPGLVTHSNALELMRAVGLEV